MEFFQQVILGILQGIIEWLPISSEGVLLLVNSNFFQGTNIDLFIRQALFLHLGTFFAALVYFRKDVLELFKGALRYNYASTGTKKTLKFLLVATLISGIIGLTVLSVFDLFTINEIPFTKVMINFVIGFLLLITGSLQLRASSAGYRKVLHLNNKDGILLGLMQGLAVFPGLSRSGLTISGFLFRNFDETVTLRLSFIMSLPIVLLGNILLNFSDIVFMKEMFFGFLFAFIFGLLTIQLLMSFSRKVKFGFFAISFGLLTILAGVVSLF
jgi:undecaprenyl-diphosphatase|tara:strand:+ start:248 stop:1057 length:810 start_codon:yes stop_codon:yes gene_type:complete